MAGALFTHDEFERLRNERDQLAERLREVEVRARRDPKREQEACDAILWAMPPGVRAKVVIIVKTMHDGTLYATCGLPDKSWWCALAQCGLEHPDFVRRAAFHFTAGAAPRVFAADIAASVPPQRGRP